MRIFALAALSVLLLAGAARAAPTHYHLFEGDLSIGDVIYQQSPDFCHPGPGWDGTRQDECVTNPHGFHADRCVWNVDDFWTVSAVGRKIEADVVASGTLCMIHDWRVPFWGVRVTAAKPGLEVSLRFEPAGVTFRLDPVQLDRDIWEWKGCLMGPSYPGRSVPPLYPIEGSNGGLGLLGSATFTVANTSGKFIANPQAIAILRPGLRSSYCVGERVDMYLGGASFWVHGFTVG